MTGFYVGTLCTSSCGCIIVCIFVWDYRFNLMICGGIFVWCVVIYVKTHLIYDHLFIHSRKNIFKNTRYFCIWSIRVYVVSERISVHSSPEWVWWTTLYKIHGFCLIIILVIIIDVSGSIKLVNTKEFVVFWPWWSI